MPSARPLPLQRGEPRSLCPLYTCRPGLGHHEFDDAHRRAFRTAMAHEIDECGRARHGAARLFRGDVSVALIDVSADSGTSAGASLRVQYVERVYNSTIRLSQR